MYMYMYIYIIIYLWYTYHHEISVPELPKCDTDEIMMDQLPFIQYSSAIHPGWCFTYELAYNPN